MLIRRVSIVVVIILSLFPSLALADGTHKPVIKEPINITQGEYEIDIYVYPEPIKTGKTEFQFLIMKNDKQIESTLLLEYEMDDQEHANDGHDSHGKETAFVGLQQVELPFDAEHSMHLVMLDIPIKGQWNFTILFEHGADHQESHSSNEDRILFHLNVLDSGPNLIFLAMLGNIMVLTMVASAIIQRKKEVEQYVAAE